MSNYEKPIFGNYGMEVASSHYTTFMRKNRTNRTSLQKPSVYTDKINLSAAENFYTYTSEAVAVVNAAAALNIAAVIVVLVVVIGFVIPETDS